MGSIAIVGGGIVGTSLAYHLGETAHDVTLFEKGSLGAETTGKSIACFGWYPFYAGHKKALINCSWETYGPLIEDGTISYHQSGLLETAETEAGVDELKAGVGALQESGQNAAVLDPQDIEQHNVSPDIAPAGAAFFPAVGRLDPGEIVTHFAETAREQGVSIETGVEVTDIHVDERGISGLTTSDGARESDIVINAAGPWARQLNETVGLSLPLKQTFAPISVLDTTENFDLPTVILEDGFYITGERSSKVLVGHAPHESNAEDPWGEALELERPESKQGVGMGSVGERHRALVAEKAPQVVPKLEGAKLSNEWRGLRCVTPDYRPMVGPTEIEGYHVATGMSGWGMTLAPACAQLLAEYLTTGTVRDALAYLSPSRFSETDDTHGFTTEQ